MTANDDTVAALVSEIEKTRKYRCVCRDLVAKLAARELSKGRSANDALKAVKNKLHQIGGSFFGGGFDRAAALAAVAEAFGGGACGDGMARDVLPAGARPGLPVTKRLADILNAHASTRERLAAAPDLFERILGMVPTPRSVIDLGCGLNPLLALGAAREKNIEYHAYDIYTDLMDFLNDAFAAAGVSGFARAMDLSAGAPAEKADLAFALKLLPVLEQSEKGSAKRLIEEVKAPRAAVSFPAKSLGGRDKNMAANYSAWFRETIAGIARETGYLEFDNEIVFIIEK